MGERGASPSRPGRGRQRSGGARGRAGPEEPPAAVGSSPVEGDSGAQRPQSWSQSHADAGLGSALYTAVVLPNKGIETGRCQGPGSYVSLLLSSESVQLGNMRWECSAAR